MSILNYPLNSLKQGHWFKLICGASYQHLPSVRNLTLAYALAGADCIDVAADPATIASAKAALQVASEIAADCQRPGVENIFNKRQAIPIFSTPLLMVSLNDGEDPHFRKAEFDPAACPPNCPRPCEKICPAEAIAFPESSNSKSNELNSISFSPKSESPGFSGVIDAKCYGCGRCLPVCPIGQIQTRSYVSTPQAVADLVLPCGVDAVEIHTQVGRLEDFKRLWSAIAPWVHGEGDRQPLKLIAISCPDGENLIEYLWSLYEAISPLPCPLIWQTDGRPMSGDIGAGTTHASIKLGQKVLRAGLPGYVQLAGGTNNYTVSKLRAANLLKTSDVNAAPLLSPLSNESINPMALPPLSKGGSAIGSMERSINHPLPDGVGKESINPSLPSHSKEPPLSKGGSAIGLNPSMERSINHPLPDSVGKESINPSLPSHSNEPPLSKGGSAIGLNPSINPSLPSRSKEPPLSKGGLGGLTIAGVAYGSYARVLLSPLLDRLEQLCYQERHSKIYLENYPELLWSAVNLANSLVSQLKMGLELQCSTHNTKR